DHQWLAGFHHGLAIEARLETGELAALVGIPGGVTRDEHLDVRRLHLHDQGRRHVHDLGEQIDELLPLLHEVERDLDGARHGQSPPSRAPPDALVSTGSTNWNTAPCGVFGVAQSLPPCASTIERLMESPKPMPLGLLVANASKRESTMFGSIPTPASSTATSTLSRPFGSDRMTSSRRRSATALIASIPFITRLRITCCSW